MPLYTRFSLPPYPLYRPRLSSGVRHALPLILIVALAIGWTAALSIVIVKHDSAGVTLMPAQSGMIVSKVDPSASPLCEGDLVTEIAGIRYGLILGYLFSFPDPTEDENTVQLVRCGVSTTAHIRPVPVGPLSYLKDAWPHLTLIAALLVSSLLAALLAPPEQPASPFVLSFTSFALLIANQLIFHFGVMDPAILSGAFWGIVVCNWLAFSAWTHFVMKFPVEHSRSDGHIWIAAAYVLPPAISLLAAYLTAGADLEFFGMIQRLRRWSVPFIITGTWCKLVFDFFTSPSHLVRNQLKWPLLSFFIGIGPYLLLYLLPSLIQNRPLVDFRLVILSGTLIPVAFLLSMIRHRLMDIDETISKTLTYFFLIGTSYVLYAVLLTVIGERFHLENRISEHFIYIYLLLIAFFFNPFKNRIQSLFDRLIFHDRSSDLTLILHDLSRRIATAIQLSDLVEILIRKLPETLGIERSCLLIVEGEQIRSYPQGQGLDKTLRPGNPLLEALNHKGGILVCHPHYGDSGIRAEMDEIVRAGFAMVIGLKSGAAFLGLLLLGPKITKRLYTKKEFQVYATLANQVAIALENALRYEALQESKDQLQTMFKKVVQSEKLAAIGEMTTILAHEIKNPLGVIRSSAEYLVKKKRDDHIRHELMQNIVDEVDAMDLVVNNLLGLARYKPPEFSPVHPGKHLAALIARWENSAGHRRGVTITVENTYEGPEIHADEKQLSQVFLNLIRNSEEAMPAGGNLFITVAGDPQKGGVTWLFTDEGTGITEKDRLALFKKFFTTKEKGSGLGLAVCRQIVTMHDGSIELYNNKTGPGATARVRLPRRPHSASGKTRSAGAID